ncbi:MAG: hypothetical protein JWQ35_724 [Bacteriovoracaceae bacterium]|nr:hypothetical protein [Bacteriovoracaceae bacterium]
MGTMKYFLVFSLCLFLTGCGSDPFIAKKVKFRVLFSQKIVQVKFELNPTYNIKQTRNFAFDHLGTLFLNWTDQTQLTEIGANLTAEPATLQRSWPTKKIKSLPAGRNFPPSIPNGSLQSWSKGSNDFTANFFFQGTPQLIAGGALLSSQFNTLPKKFFATQRFFAANGDVQATISAAGPIGSNPGGIYLFGNFGVNPFSDTPSNSSAETLEGFRPMEIAQDREWEIVATEPAQIVNAGSTALAPATNLVQNLQKQILDFKAD